MPFISKYFIDKLLDESNILDIIKDFVDLKKSGTNWQGLSPFTKEQTPSFMVSESKQIWKDFSTSKGGNNAISFLMEKGKTFVEAIEYIAGKYGKEIEYEDTKESKAYQEKITKQNDLRPILKATINQYLNKFTELPENHPAKEEVYGKRKYNQDIVDTYQIGYAPGSNFIYNILKEQGLFNDGKQIGIVSDKHDFFNHRVTYTIFDNNGNPVGMAGRDLSGDNKPKIKWLNSKESVLYDKSKVWYGLHLAKEKILQTSRAYVVEGYNDVIAWQTNDIENTVAPCGTSITYGQIKLLKKYADTVVFCMDPDSSGEKSVLRNIPLFLESGFRTSVVKLPCDPDDFSRTYKEEIDKKGLEQTLQKNSTQEDGFKTLLKQLSGKDEIEKTDIAKQLCEIISKVSDDGHRMIYIKWLQKDSGLTKKVVEDWVKKFTLSAEAESLRKIAEFNSEYQFPKGIEPTEALISTVKKYQIFQAKDQIYIMVGDNPPYAFRSISNFSIEIIQHMQDEKFPMKLVRIKNVHGLEKIFDVPSESMNTPMQFDNSVTAHGNFLYTGGRNEFQKLRAFLFDRMGNGRKIDVLGWQPEGFWSWNNKITVPGKTSIDIDENGVFKFEGVSYYVPSANKIYANNPFMYEGQKKMLCNTPSFNLTSYMLQLKKVHRDHAITSILFSLATPFQDLVVSAIKNFPLLFLSGPPSTGKDQLAACCQGFFGIPQTGIGLASGISTAKAKVREFAQFSNIIAQLSEYKRGDTHLDEMLKDLWDRRGYKRGNLNSHVGNESIPILSSVIITSNDFPDNDALLTRVIWEEMVLQNFSDESIKEYEKLEDMNKEVVSGFIDDLIHAREDFEKQFKRKYRGAKDMLSSLLPETKSRIIGNYSVLFATYQIFEEKVSFPFSKTEMLEHFKSRIEALERKLATASTVSKWWDCFLASLRGHKDDRLRVGHDLKVEGTILFFNFTNSYLKIQRQWYVQYRENAPGKSIMMDQLRKEDSFIRYENYTRMDSGRSSKRTSAYVIDMERLGRDLLEEITDAVNFQLDEGTTFNNPNSPVTPENQNNNEKTDENGEPELPF
ncbi:DNA primase [Abyssalbus ytuae]|uniref:DNA primase n=1 Tax=Abyssalbus ytuae TaxID=2926907 RepID=A0A9E6ZJB0_9FLAO|nr:DNA primase [Abyssalbus ytuae]UOB16607.1 DNA primase [Abyssalbus ytuae]